MTRVDSENTEVGANVRRLPARRRSRLALARRTAAAGLQRHGRAVHTRSLGGPLHTPALGGTETPGAGPTHARGEPEVPGLLHELRRAPDAMHRCGASNLGRQDRARGLIVWGEFKLHGGA